MTPKNRTSFMDGPYCRSGEITANFETLLTEFDFEVVK